MTKKQKKSLTLILLSAVLLAAAKILSPMFDAIPHFDLGCYLVPYLIIGIPSIKKAVRNIINGQIFDENFLMTLATVGAFIIGEYAEGVFVMLFYRIGELFESIAVSKSRKSITELGKIRPDHAEVIRDGKVIEVTPDDVRPNEIIVIRKGDRVPLDGIVTEGVTELDTSAITGESVPMFAGVGDRIISGFVNTGDVIKVKVTGSYETSTVARILELVENSTQNKSKSESFITRFSRYYTPTVVILAALIAFVPPIFFGNLASFVKRALVFLVVSCPCALVISVPLAFFGGIGAASKHGILVKGSDYLEKLGNINTAVFDKTGTLTTGELRVSSVHSDTFPENELLFLAAVAEKYSTHPLAKAIRNAANCDIPEPDSITETAGRGIEATYDNKKILVGNRGLFCENGITVPDLNYGNTVLLVAVDGIFAGYISVSDTLKNDAKSVFEDLRKLGTKKIFILSGDNNATVKEAANVSNADGYFAELLPEDKVRKTEELKENVKNGNLIFVGDGINDAPVLALADVGVAMGALGSDAAIDAADVILTDDKLSAIKTAVGIARKTLKISRENIVFAIGVKIAVLSFGALGIAPIWLAVFADVGVSVIAILNSIRTLN